MVVIAHLAKKKTIPKKKEGGDQSNDAVPDMQVNVKREGQGETREARVHTIKSVVMVCGVVVEVAK